MWAAQAHVDGIDHELALKRFSLKLNGRKGRPQARLAVERLSALAVRTSCEQKLSDERHRG